MSYSPDPDKQIHLLGLERTGEGVYRCKYPLLLVEWLKKHGLVEVKAHGYREHTELMLEGDIHPESPESTLPAWRERGYVSIYKTGSVRVGAGHTKKLEELLDGLLRK